MLSKEQQERNKDFAESRKTTCLGINWLKDNTPFELVTADNKHIIIIKYNSETKQLVVKAGNNTLKSRLVN